MLSIFRRGGVAQFFVAAIVFAIIIVFILEFRAGRGASGPLSTDCVIELDGSCVEPKEYFAALGLIVHPSLQPKQVKRMELHRRVLQGLAERELLLREARRLGISIKEESVEEALLKGHAHVSLPAEVAEQLSYALALCKPTPMGCAEGTEMIRQLDVVRDGKLDYPRYTRMVRNLTNRSPKEFKAMQERELIAARMRDLVRSRVRVSDEEAFLEFERARSQVTVRTVEARSDWFAKYVVKLTPSEVDDWAAANKPAVDAAFAAQKAEFTADCPVVQEITVAFGAVPTEDSKALKRTEIEAAQKLLKRKDFEEVARVYSDADSAKRGGRIGCLSESYGPGAKDLLQAVGELEPGQVSDIVETSQGYHLLKLERLLPKGEVEAVARQHIALELAVEAKAKELSEAFTKELIAKAKSGVDLDKAALELATSYAARGSVGDAPKKADDAWPALGDDARPKVEISAPFAITSSPLVNALPTENVAAKAFKLEKAGAVHDAPIATSRGFAMMQLKDKELATRESFNEDKAELVSRLQQIKAQGALERYIDRLRSQAGDKLRIDARYSKAPGSDEPKEES